MSGKVVWDTVKPYVIKGGKAAAVAILTAVIEKVGNDNGRKTIK
ncbi:hypothetical protein [Priestia megaterium]|nr:hypothetical protein [Priestia megaterium]